MIATYDYIDVTQGTGYIDLYLASDQTGYILSPSSIYSNKIAWLSAELTQTVNTKVFDNTFVVVLNKPLNINGNVLALISGGHYLTVSAVFGSIYFIVKVIKIDLSSNETTIAQATSTTSTTTNAHLNSQDWTHLLKIPVTNIHYKKGESIGIRLEGYAWKSNANTTVQALIGHDPKNRISAITSLNVLKTSVGIVSFPTKVDL